MKNEIIPGFSRVDHVGITVPDLDAAVRFYCNVFGCTECFRMGPFDARELPAVPDGRDWGAAHVNVPDARFRFVMLQLGPNLMLELFQYDRPTNRREQLPRNCDLGGHHLALKVQDIDRAIEYLKGQSGVNVMEGPIVVTDGPCAGMRVIYFLDPWGNQMELVEFNR
jgi:catechol 2,3-dioxygenase-like lactoylglutathione lyase family enzyme